MVADNSITLREDKGWYVETAVDRHGPFVSETEAHRYQALLSKVSAAGIACSWLTRDQRKTFLHIGLKRLTRNYWL